MRKITWVTNGHQGCKVTDKERNKLGQVNSMSSKPIESGRPNHNDEIWFAMIHWPKQSSWERKKHDHHSINILLRFIYTFNIYNIMIIKTITIALLLETIISGIVPYTSQMNRLLDSYQIALLLSMTTIVYLGESR